MQEQTQPAGKILRWIKANERLPDVGRRVSSKNINDKPNSRTEMIITNNAIWIGDDCRNLIHPCLGDFLQGVEWLEELSAPASPVEEKPEEFEIWANEYANRIMADSPRAFREHLGAEIHSALYAAHRHLTEAKPSPVIEIPSDLEGLIGKNALKYGNDLKKAYGPGYDELGRHPVVDFMAGAEWNAKELAKVKEELLLCIRERNKYLYQLDAIADAKASHSAPAPIVGDGEEDIN